MINNLFYSTSNKNAIKDVIGENINIKKNSNINIIIDETMQYVSSKVSQTPPKGVKNEEYLFLMNKKVYDIILPILSNVEQSKKETNHNIIKPIKNEYLDTDTLQYPIKNPVKNRSQNTIQNTAQNTAQNTIQNTIFDPLILQNYDSPSTLMDYPKPSMNKINIEKSDVKIKKLEDDRSALIPKIKPIDFTIKDNNENKQDTMQLYNEMLTNMNNFENEQKSINKINESEVDQLINNNLFIPFNLSDPAADLSTPIDLLNNENDNLIFSTKNDVKNNKSNLKNNKNNLKNNKNEIKNIEIETFLNNNLNNNLNNSLSNNFNFSDVNPKTKDVIIDEPKFILIEKKFHIIFDSSDRDLYEYPNQTQFQIKFSPAGNNYRYENYYDSYNTLIIQEKTIVVGDATDLSVNQTFDNIQKIVCNTVNVPVNIIYIGNTINNNPDGSSINIFKEPYLYLVIPEFRGPYIGGNIFAYQSFAKLAVDYSQNTHSYTGLIDGNFTVLKTADTNETFIYEPVSTGKIDKMTLNLLNKNGVPYNFGIDKLYVNQFNEGNYRYGGCCGEQYLTTVINIQNINDEYIKYCKLYYKAGNCNYLNNHSIKKGDLLYFYDTTPNNDQVVFLESYIYISKMKYSKKNNEIIIYLNYKKVINNEETIIDVNLKNVIFEDTVKDYYIVIFNTKTNKYYYLKVVSLSDSSITVNYLDIMPQFKDYSFIKAGIAKSNLRGINDNEVGSLFNKTGYTVINVGDTPETLWNIEIDYPYDNLPDYLKDSNIYYPGEIFLIQKKLQISYTFTVTSKIKDYQKLNSGLN